MTKGFALAVDAMVAALVLLAFTIAFAYFSYHSQTDPLVSLVMKKQAGDLLTVLDKSGQLQAKNITLINSTLNSSLPVSSSWMLEVYYYNYSNGFVLSDTLNASRSASPVDPVVAEREFLVIINDSTSQYGVARLSLWAG